MTYNKLRTVSCLIMSGGTICEIHYSSFIHIHVFMYDPDQLILNVDISVKILRFYRNYNSLAMSIKLLTTLSVMLSLYL
jgi:hypothetical protein